MIIENIELTNYGIKYKINIKNFLNKTIIQDLKILIFGEYNENNELQLRKEPITVDNISKEKHIGDEIILKTGKNTIIGKGKITEDRKVKLTHISINNKESGCVTDIYDLFEFIQEHNIDKYKCKTEDGKNIWKYCKGKEKLKTKTYNIPLTEENKKTIKKIYLNNLFKIYYDSIVCAAIINSVEKIEGKASALANYISIKTNLNEYFEKNKLDIRISNPNVFIKNINMEFDTLIVTKGKENEYFYDLENVKAIIEIKTSGYIADKKSLIQSHYECDKEDSFISYIKASHKKIPKEFNIPYIYLSIYESFGQKKTSVHYYEFLLANILSLESDLYIGMFCGTKENSTKYLIPYDYDLNEILKILNHKKI